MGKITRKAWIYISIFYVLAGVLVIAAWLGYDPAHLSWETFWVLLGLSTVGQLYRSEAPPHQLYHPALIFIFAALLLLDPFLFVIIILVAHSIEWIKERLLNSKQLRNWYIQPYNISVHIIVGFIARQVFLLINPGGQVLTSTPALIGACTAAVIYALLNHLLIGAVIVLARHVAWRETGILFLENISTDLVMLVFGYMVAILTWLNLWLILPALIPLYLIYRSLAVPMLKRQANTDPKTGLWNAEYFNRAFEAEFSRSVRFDRPLTVIIGDIDLLRNINNTYGHLAGDAVLVGLAWLLRQSFRDYDVIARFGGEEYAILMPETTTQEALPRIEQVRKLIEQSTFEAPITHQKIRVTMSFGVAGLNGLTLTTNELLHFADVAVYAAKLKGRNLVCQYTQEIAALLDADQRGESGSYRD